MSEPRRPTSTSAFGVGRRENHDASAFYARFPAPTLSDDAEIEPYKAVDEIYCGDARDMHHIKDASVALVVTSPPYFAGKEYEEALGEGHIPASYVAYLDMLEAVFAECVRTLEPGGRIAVNVANLGRKPYRSLSADVIGVLQDRLGMLMRGEIIWQKARGAGGSCAWGSFQRPGNPVLRDVTERVIVASKGRFDRPLSQAKRAAAGLPSVATIRKDDFTELTTDVWELPPESATRVGHPAPFPPELPERLIHLYTYAGDLVLDPFMGSGTTAVAAVRTGRHYAGYDTDADYCEAARQRVAAEVESLTTDDDVDGRGAAPTLAAGRAAPVAPDAGWAERVATWIEDGQAVRKIVEEALEFAGFRAISKDPATEAGAVLDWSATGTDGTRWLFVTGGSFTAHRGGLLRTDALWRTAGEVAVAAASDDRPIALLTTHLPPEASPARRAIDALVAAGSIAAVVDLMDPASVAQLEAMSRGSA